MHVNNMPLLVLPLCDAQRGIVVPGAVMKTRHSLDFGGSRGKGRG